jgi:hypothetical protein
MESIYQPFIIRGSEGEEIDLIGEMQGFLRRATGCNGPSWSVAARRGYLARTAPWWFGTRNRNHIGKVDLVDIEAAAKLVHVTRHTPHGIQLWFFDCEPGSWPSRPEAAGGYVVYSASKTRVKVDRQGQVREYSEDTEPDDLLAVHFYTQVGTAKRAFERLRWLRQQYDRVLEETAMSRIEFETDHRENDAFISDQDAAAAMHHVKFVEPLTVREARVYRASTAPRKTAMDELLEDEAAFNAEADLEDDEVFADIELEVPGTDSDAEALAEVLRLATERDYPLVSIDEGN